MFLDLLDQWSQTRGPQEGPMRLANFRKKEVSKKYQADWYIFQKLSELLNFFLYF